MKTIKYSVWAFGVLAMANVFSACESENAKDNTSAEVEELGVPTNVTEGDMKPVDQKKRIDQAIQHFLSEYNVSDFEYLGEMSNYSETLLSNDGTNVQTWFSELIGSMTSLVKATPSQIVSPDGTLVENICTSDFKQLIVLSQFVGHFSLKNGVWSYEKAKDLQFTFTDQEGKTATLSLSTSGKSTDVFWGTGKDYDYDYSEEDGVRIYDIYENLYERTLRVPEHIKAELKQGGTVKASLNVDVALSGFKDGQPDFAKSTLSGTATLTVGKYAAKITKASYEPTKGAHLSYAIYKGDKRLLYLGASVEGNYSKERIGKVDLMADLMGEVQVRGTLSDYDKYDEYDEAMWEASDNESEFVKALEKANELLDLGVYYDGKSVRQAKVVLVPMFEPYGNWYADPVFYFGDETTYSTYGAFFEERMDNCRNQLDKLLEEFEKYFQ